MSCTASRYFGRGNNRYLARCTRDDHDDQRHYSWSLDKWWTEGIRAMKARKSFDAEHARRVAALKEKRKAE